MGVHHTFEFDPTHHLVTVTPSGTPDFHSSIDDILALASHPAFTPDVVVLCDFRAIRYVPSPAEALEFGRLFGQPDIFRGRRLAYVVAESLHAAVAQTIAIVAGVWGAEVAVFEDVDSARRWLLRP